MSYASVEDVAARLGVDPLSLNTSQVQAVLDDTSALAYAYTGRDFSASPPIPDPIRYVVAQRTIRVLNNPDGIRQETIGTYSYSLAADASVLAGGWTDEERLILDTYGRSLARRRAGSFAIGYGGSSAEAE